MPASCKQVFSSIGLERGLLRAKTLTSLHPRLVSQSSWRKLSLPLLVGCKVELRRGPRSSW